jgi:hypothetical protein
LIDVPRVEQNVYRGIWQLETHGLIKRTLKYYRHVATFHSPRRRAFHCASPARTLLCIVSLKVGVLTPRFSSAASRPWMLATRPKVDSQTH